MVIIGIREESKLRTREKIILASELLIHRKGFVKISSKEIARECDVSQGSIFLHFGTKDGLLGTILTSNIDDLESDLKEYCITSKSQDIFLKNYLDIQSKYEDILSRIYKDYSYLDGTFTKRIDQLEVMVKNLFFDNYKKNKKRSVNIVDSFIIIDAFLSQIKEYLISKDTFTSSNSVIRQKRGRISKLYRILFS